MTTVLLDTHVVHWWSTEPHRLSQTAAAAINGADEVAIAAISWFELAWLATHDRLVMSIPTRSWLEQMATQVRTVGATPAIAHTAVSLASSFPNDPADRLIYATAIEQGWTLITKDRKMRSHPHPRALALW